MTSRPLEPRVVKVAWASPGTEFNDMLCGIGPEAAKDFLTLGRSIAPHSLEPLHHPDRLRGLPSGAAHQPAFQRDVLLAKQYWRR
jgi:hypothetical protein